MPDTPAPDEVAQLRAEDEFKTALVNELTEAHTQLLLEHGGLKNENTALTARVAELEAELGTRPAAGRGRGCVMQWQPIETAPKDGTRILAADADGHISTAVYLQDWSESMVFIRAERDGDVFKKKVEDVGYWHMDDDDACGATHWMPLPAPPNTTAPAPGKEGGSRG